MDGGKLVATGSSSCIFNPNFPCRKNGVIDKDRISKIIYSPGAKKESQHEKKMNEKIKKIKGSQEWSLIFDQYCKPFSKDKLITYDRKGIRDCFKSEYDKEYIENFDANSYMMNGEYGGITFEEYFEITFRGKGTDKKFLNLMEKMEPLFLGLKEMSKNNIIHNDIKYNNIVVHEGVLKFIDFGLSNSLSMKNHFKERSLDEYKSGRIYIHYPLEYILYYAPKEKLNLELESLDHEEVRRVNFPLLQSVNLLFSMDIHDIYHGTVYAIKRGMINQTEMIKGIDIYSLGIQVPLLFLTKYPNSNIFKKPSQLLMDFYGLFGKMTTPLSKDRINASECYGQFKTLLDKYRDKKVVSSKKSKKQKKQKKRKK